MDERQSK